MSLESSLDRLALSCKDTQISFTLDEFRDYEITSPLPEFL